MYDNERLSEKLVSISYENEALTPFGFLFFPSFLCALWFSLDEDKVISQVIIGILL